MMKYSWRPGCSILCGVLTIYAGLSAEIIGIVGGGSTVSLISNTEFVIPVVNSVGLNIHSVAMNNSALSVIGGNFGGFCYGALINSSETVTPLSTNQIAGHNGTYFDVAINRSGDSVLAGDFQFNQPFGASSDSLGNATALSGFIPNCSNFGTKGFLFGAAINDSSLAVFGGAPGQNPNNGVYAGVLPADSDTVNQELCVLYSMSNTSNIFGVDINASGQTIAGGFLLGDRYGVLFDATQTSPTLVPIPFPAGGQINGVAINAEGISIAGGIDSVGAAYATLVEPNGELIPLSGASLPIQGTIKSVSMSESCGNAIIGGQDTINNAAYAALVDPSGKVSNVAGLPTGAAGAMINSVSMNAWGVSLIGGTADGVNAYAALVEPSGALLPLSVSGSPISSVSIRNFVPSNTLEGNNKIFAQFINDNAPDKACFFIPSLISGEFADALMSASPQRNAISLFTVENNVFLLNHTLSVHLRNHHRFRYHPFLAQMEQSALAKQNLDKISLIAQLEKKELIPDTSSCEQEKKTTPACMPLDRPFTLWGGAVGAQISQKAQHQTAGFDPSVGGFILALEKAFGEINQAGGGIAYLFTHVHEKEGAGFSNINQELLFLYASWANEYYYVDAALWAGIFQTRQVRDMHMPGYHFRSQSDPDGFQLSPHVELGYDKNKWIHGNQKWQLILDPFAMADWVNAWQDGYEETGDGPFNITQSGHYSSFLRTEAGFRFYEVLALNAWYLTFLEKGSYVYKQPFHIGKFSAFLVGSPGSFTVETLSNTEHLGLLELAMMFEPVNQSYPYGSISYQGEFGSSYQSHQLTLEWFWDF